MNKTLTISNTHKASGIITTGTYAAITGEAWCNSVYGGTIVNEDLGEFKYTYVDHSYTYNVYIETTKEEWDDASGTYITVTDTEIDTRKSYTYTSYTYDYYWENLPSTLFYGYPDRYMTYVVPVTPQPEVGDTIYLPDTAGNGGDDTAVIQAAIDSLLPGKTLMFGANKTYKVSIQDDYALYIHAYDVVIDLNGSKIELIGNKCGAAVIGMFMCNNTRITNGIIESDRLTHNYNIKQEGTTYNTYIEDNINTHEGCNHCIKIIQSEGCTISHIEAYNSPGDAISIAGDCGHNCTGDGWFATPARHQYAGSHSLLEIGIKEGDSGIVSKTNTSIAQIKEWYNQYAAQYYKYTGYGEANSSTIKFVFGGFNINKYIYDTSHIYIYFYDENGSFLSKYETIFYTPYLYMGNIPEDAVSFGICITGFSELPNETTPLEYNENGEYEGSWINIEIGSMNSANIDILECVLHDCRRQGISAGSVNNLFINNNEIYNIGEYGLGYSDLANNTVGGLPPGAGVDVEEGINYRVSVYRNTIYNCDYGVVLPGSLFGTVHENNIYNCGFIGYISGNNNEGKMYDVTKPEIVENKYGLFIHSDQSFKNCDFTNYVLIFESNMDVRCTFTNCIMGEWKLWDEDNFTADRIAEIKANPNYKFQIDSDCTFVASWDDCPFYEIEQVVEDNNVWYLSETMPTSDKYIRQNGYKSTEPPTGMTGIWKTPTLLFMAFPTSWGMPTLTSATNPNDHPGFGTTNIAEDINALNELNNITNKFVVLSNGTSILDGEYNIVWN